MTVVLGDSWVDDLFAEKTWVKHVFTNATSFGKLLSKVEDIDKQRKVIQSEKYVIHVGGNNFLINLPNKILNHFVDCVRIYYGPLAREVFEEYRKTVAEMSQDSRVVVCSIPIGPAVPCSVRIIMLTAPFQCKKVTETIRQLIDTEFRRQFITLPDVVLFDIYEVVKKNKIKYHFDGLHPSDHGHKVIAEKYNEESFLIKDYTIPTFTKFEACVGTFFSVILGLVIVPIVTMVVYTHKKVKPFF